MRLFLGCLNYGSFVLIGECGSVYSAKFVLLFQDCLAVLGFFPSHVNFMINLLIKKKKSRLDFDRECVESVDYGETIASSY